MVARSTQSRLIGRAVSAARPQISDEEVGPLAQRRLALSFRRNAEGARALGIRYVSVPGGLLRLVGREPRGRFGPHEGTDVPFRREATGQFRERAIFPVDDRQRQSSTSTPG